MTQGPTDKLSPYAAMLGIRWVSLAKDKIVAEMPIRADMANLNGTAHGGAILSLLDQVAGMGARQNLATTQSTVTVESKTNFFSTIPLGDVAHAEGVPLHVGRTTSVWLTRITRGDGKLAAICTQTQLVLEPKS